jgi:hypothetical protein
MKPAHRPLPAGDADPSGWKARTAARALREVDDVAGADNYVRAMVVFALVLFRVVMGERFKVCGVPIAANTVADGLLADGLCAISTLAQLLVHHPCQTALSREPASGARIGSWLSTHVPSGSDTRTLGSASARGGR